MAADFFLLIFCRVCLLTPHKGKNILFLSDQFIACGKSRDMAHELASRIWLAVLDNLEENERTFLLLKRLALEGDVS